MNSTYRYAFNAKEHQPELGLNWHDYHARNYDAALGRWMNVDPLVEEMPSHSPYNYAFNNSVYFIDPDGMMPMDIIIWFKDQNGKDTNFRYTGENLHDAPGNEFVNAVLGAIFYNTSNGGGDKLQEAANDRENDHHIIQGKEREGSSSYADMQFRNIISWDFTGGLKTENGDVLSPATILEHEADHSISRVKNWREHIDRGKIPDDNYGNKEEKRVVQGSETKTARANGEISESKTYSRTTHGRSGKRLNKRVKVKNETSTEIIKKY